MSASGVLKRVNNRGPRTDPCGTLVCNEIVNDHLNGKCGLRLSEYYEDFSTIALVNTSKADRCAHLSVTQTVSPRG